MQIASLQRVKTSSNNLSFKVYKGIHVGVGYYVYSLWIMI